MKNKRNIMAIMAFALAAGSLAGIVGANQITTGFAAQGADTSLIPDNLPDTITNHVPFVPKVDSLHDAAWGFSYVGMTAVTTVDGNEVPLFKDFGIWTNKITSYGGNVTVTSLEGNVDTIDQAAEDGSQWQCHGTYIRIYQNLLQRHGDFLVVPKGWGFWCNRNDGTVNATDTYYYTEQEYKYVCTLEDGETGSWETYAAPTSASLVDGDGNTSSTIGAGTFDTITLTGTAVGETNAEVSYISSDPDIAKVDPLTGVVTPVSGGTTTITARFGDVVSNGYTVTVTPDTRTDAQITRANFRGIMNYFSVLKGTDVSAWKPIIPECSFTYASGPDTKFAALAADDYTISGLDTSKLGMQEITVNVKKGERTDIPGTIKVNVYEEKKWEDAPLSAQLVDWMNYCIFVDASNISTCMVNLTNDNELLSQTSSKIRYVRNGEDIPFGYQQHQFRIAIFPSFLYNESGESVVNGENYMDVYKVGDKIILEEGLPMLTWTGDKTPGDQAVAGTGEWIVEGRMTVQHVYRWNGTTFVYYVESNGISISNPDISLAVNSTAKIDAKRLPEGANAGSFTYESADDSIASVLNSGVVVGNKKGKTTITVTWHQDDDPTLTRTAKVNVTVTDAATALTVTAPEEGIKLNFGSALNIDGVTAEVTLASGAKEAVVLTTANVSGYDAHKAGVQELDVKVTIDGVELTAKLSVTVLPEPTNTLGIAMSVVAGVAIAGVIGLTVLFFLKKGKKA